MKKYGAVVMASLIMAMLLSGCNAAVYQKLAENHPEMRPGTCWGNEEKTVLFHVGDDEEITGIIDADPGIVDVKFDMVEFLGRFEAAYDDADADMIESWYYSVASDDAFTARVKETTYFHEGDEFTFHRISQGEYEAGLRSMGAFEAFAALLGETAGQAYRNEYFNFAAAFDDGWHICTEEELNESRGYAADELMERALYEALRSPEGVPVLRAKSADGTASVSVTIRKNAKENAERAEDEYEAIAKETLPEAFEDAGMVLHESTGAASVDFAGQPHAAVTMHATYNGVDIYETLAAVKQGEHCAVIAATSVGQDSTMFVLDAFRPADA